MKTPKSANHPNIIVILADDIGIGDVGHYNSDSRIPTPNIDQLARNGVSFTDAHSASALCTPSRYGILTGRYCWRSSLPKEVLFNYEPPLIEAERLTLPRMLKNAGYNTACIGKWHLGLNYSSKQNRLVDFQRTMPWPEGDRYLEESIDFSKGVSGGPTELGFDYFFGTSGCSTAQPPYAFIENEGFVIDPSFYNEWFPNTGRPGMTALSWDPKEADPTFTRKARDYILRSKNAENPFFLYFAASAAHEPCVEEVVPEFARGKSAAGPRGDLVWLFDWMVGEIVDALKETGELDNTLILITSDNGALPGDRVVSARGQVVYHTYGHKSCGDWRGYKANVWEGGHREPFIAHWPGKLEAGSTYDGLFSLNDVLATLAALVGEELPLSAAEDSFNIGSGLFGSSGIMTARPNIIHHSQTGVFSIRRGDWKLIHDTMGSGSSGDDDRVIPQAGYRGQLYNMKDDPYETNNLFMENMDLVVELTNLLIRQKTEPRSIT